MTVDKNALVRQIAETAYNVGFGAKKHFATFDIIEKIPNWISFISIVFGVLGLYLEPFSSKHASAVLLIFGIGTFYISSYNGEKNRYEEVGKRLTVLLAELRSLRDSVLAEPGLDLSSYEEQLRRINEEFQKCSISKQIFLTDWYAHYKFHWQQQTGWINEELKFGFFRDRIPLSFWVSVLAVVIMILLFLCWKVFCPVWISEFLSLSCS